MTLGEAVDRVLDTLAVCAAAHDWPPSEVLNMTIPEALALSRLLDRGAKLIRKSRSK